MARILAINMRQKLHKHSWENMKEIISIWITTLSILFLCGCSSPRWQIRGAEYSYRSKEKPDDEYFTKNTILIDTRTGKTWMLSPSGENDADDYYWVEMRHKPKLSGDGNAGNSQQADAGNSRHASQ